jgi:hypothetical protein
MKNYIILAFILAGFFFNSCEDKDRLEEIKASLKKEKTNKRPDEKKVSFSAPSINEPEPELDLGSMEGDGYDMYSEGYEGETYYPEYEDESYDSGYDSY